MTNADFFTELSFDLNDTQEARFSMYDKVRATNFVLRTINNFMPKTSSDLMAEGSIVVVSAQATMPTDWLDTQDIYAGSTKLTAKRNDEEVSETTYKIMGTTLYTGATGTLTVYYKKQLGTLTTAGSAPTGDFPLPVMYVELVKKYAKMFLESATQADMAFIANIEQDVRKLGSMRDKGRLNRRALWEV